MESDAQFDEWEKQFEDKGNPDEGKPGPGEVEAFQNLMRSHGIPREMVLMLLEDFIAFQKSALRLLELAKTLEREEVARQGFVHEMQAQMAGSISLFNAP